MADKDVEEKTIAEDLVVTKYKLAGQIVNGKYVNLKTTTDSRGANIAQEDSSFLLDLKIN